jgi:SAM-dependent methyltransferase
MTKSADDGVARGEQAALLPEQAAAARPDPTQQDPTGRFAGREGAYRVGRPGYPVALLEWLWSWLDAGAVVCDLGCGTGIFTRELLERGHRVYGVEPNDAMRGVAEAELGGYPDFISISGRAEATGLADASVDMIVAAQAFHWFELAATRQEARRILRPGGRMLVVWNDRLTSGSPFLEDYETFLKRWGAEAYAKVARTWDVRRELVSFFAPGQLEHRTFDNEQLLDLEGMKGRLLSSSYVPGVGHPDHAQMLVAIPELFERHQREGTVTMIYQANAYLGGW